MGVTLNAGEEIMYPYAPVWGSEKGQSLLRKGQKPTTAPDLFLDFGFLEPPPTLWYFKAKGKVYHFVQEDEKFRASLLIKQSMYQDFVVEASELLDTLSTRSAAARDAGLPCLDPDSEQRQKRCG